MISSRDVIDQTTTGGRQRFRRRGDQYVHLCLVCDAEFEQTPEGGKALREHEFTHGFATRFKWSDLHGKNLRIVVVPYRNENRYFAQDEADMYAVDDERGVVYHLAHQDKYDWDDECRGWKWKIGNQTTPSDGPKPTPPVLALLSIGSKPTAEK